MLSFTSPSTKRLAAGVVAVAAMSVSLAACGGSSDKSSSSSSSSSSSAAKPTVAKPLASIDALTGKSTAIKLDKGFVAALTSLHVAPGVVGTAKLTKTGSVVFPITGGNVTYFKPGTRSPYVIGQVQHEGSGLSLTLGDIVVTLTNFNVDPGVSRVYGDVTVNGKVAATDAYLFKLDGRTLKPLRTQGTKAILQGTKVEISDVAAPVLNQVFKTKAVKPGLLVGIATITVNTK